MSIQNILTRSGKVIKPIFSKEQGGGKDFIHSKDKQGPFVACMLANPVRSAFHGWYMFVSPEDEELISWYQWCARVNATSLELRRKVIINGKSISFQLTQAIWQRMTGYDSLHVYRLAHPLDLRRHNLSAFRLSKDNRGVTWNRGNKTWQAQTMFDGKSLYLGSASSQDEGYRIYNRFLAKLKRDFPEDMNVQLKPYNKVAPLF